MSEQTRAIALVNEAQRTSKDALAIIEHLLPGTTFSEGHLLASAIDALAMDSVCPFLRDRPLYNGLHVDVTDPECYGRSGPFSEWGVQCCICVREALEERVCAAKEAEDA